MIKRRLKFLWREARDYVRYDLKEILFPSSLPPPPGYVPPPVKRMTFNYFMWKVRNGLLDYADSWRKVHRRPANMLYNEKVEEDVPQESDKEVEKGSTKKGRDDKKEPPILVELANAARGGADRLKPALQRLYYSRTAIFKDTLRSFVEGYKEGQEEVKTGKDPLTQRYSKEFESSMKAMSSMQRGTNIEKDIDKKKDKE